MEALYYAKHSLKSKEGDELDLIGMPPSPLSKNAKTSPETNKEKWVSEHKDDRGGFVYFPGSSMAGEREAKNGSKALGHTEA